MSDRASPPSDRVRLARVALESALAVPGVVRGEAGVGVARVTADGPGLLVGVSAIAQADGRFAIDLRLVARLVPLWPLAANVRAGVQAAAARAGMAALLGSVDVEFAGVLTAEEIEQSTIAAEPTTAAIPESEPSTMPPSRPARAHTSPPAGKPQEGSE